MRRSADPLRSFLPGLQPALVGLMPALVGLLLALLAPPALAAQTLEDRELEYRQALAEYEFAAAARDVLANRFYTLFDSLAVARATDEQNRIDELEGRVLALGIQLQSRDTRVVETGEAYEVARDALLVALDQRLDSLQVVAQTSTDPIRRQEAGTLIFDLRAQYAAVEAEDLEETLRVRSVILPAFTIDPRDTPATLLAKAELLESKAEDFQSEIDQVDQALERYRRAVQLDRFLGDTRSNIDRFGDTQVPVRGATGSGRAGQGILADTAGVDLEARPPQDAIVSLEVYREQLLLARDQTLARAEEFRDRIRGVRGGWGER